MRELLRQAWPYLHRHRARLGRGMAALVAKVMAATALPLVIREGVNALTSGFSLESVWWFAAALVGLSALKGLFQYWMRVILIGISRDIEFDIRNDLFARLVTLSADFYGRTRTGDVMARATNDLNAVRMMFGPGVMYSVETTLTLLLAVIVMASVDWPLMLVALLPGPVVSAVVLFFGRRIHERFEGIQRLFSDISSRVQENLAGVRVVRAYTQEEAELARFSQLNEGYVRENIALARLQGLFQPLLQALVGVTFLAVLWVGGYRLLAGRITLGDFVLFQTYMGTLIWPMIAIGWVVNLVQRGTASFQRITELMKEVPTIAAPARPERLTEPVRGEVAFQGVTVRYGDAAALACVDLTIPAGTTIALVGHTGSGKSTLAQLIGRVLDPAEGTVRLDGHDLRALDPAQVRAVTGFVPQETFLFSSTVRENIALGAPGASEGQVQDAAERAGLGPDLAGFPAGLDTVVGERGITLSGGQRQRTAIARALLKNPRVLVLDDALSSVDTVTEERILRGLAEVMAGRTTVLISHRVSTVRHADLIVVLERGRIVERGTHAELLAHGGLYAELHQRQLLEEELEAT